MPKYNFPPLCTWVDIKQGSVDIEDLKEMHRVMADYVEMVNGKGN